MVGPISRRRRATRDISRDAISLWGGRAIRFVTAALAFLASAPAAAEPERSCDAGGDETRACGAAADDGPPVDGYLSLDLTSHYEYHGFLYAEDVPVTQGYARFTTPVYEGDGFLRAAHVGLGGFLSYHGSGDRAQGEGLFEADLLATLLLELPAGFAADLEYWLETSPNDSFSDIHELDLRLRWNDAPLWKGRLPERFGGLQPHLLLGVELDGETDLGNESFGGADTDEGVYLEAGLRPSLRLLEHETHPVTLAMPLRLGLSLSDYYENLCGEDETFGFLEAALDLSAPLPFLSRGPLALEAHASVHSFWVGGTLRDVNAAAGSDVHEWIGRIGLRATF